MREERERERMRDNEKNWGSWRNIREGGMEEECVSGKRTDEKAGTLIQFFFFSWSFYIIFFQLRGPRLIPLSEHRK